jgi:hypothetical protein
MDLPGVDAREIYALSVQVGQPGGQCPHGLQRLFQGKARRHLQQLSEGIARLELPHYEDLFSFYAPGEHAGDGRVPHGDQPVQQCRQAIQAAPQAFPPDQVHQDLGSQQVIVGEVAREQGSRFPAPYEGVPAVYGPFHLPVLLIFAILYIIYNFLYLSIGIMLRFPLDPGKKGTIREAAA